MCSALAAAPELHAVSGLMSLDLCGCGLLTRLPESLGALSVLKYIDLGNCCALTWLPESLGRLTSLVGLRLLCCKELTQLPESLGQLAALRRLEITYCDALVAMPFSFVFLRNCVCDMSYNARMTYPPPNVVAGGPLAIGTFMRVQRRRACMLLLILAAGSCSLPTELWHAFDNDDVDAGDITIDLHQEDGFFLNM